MSETQPVELDPGTPEIDLTSIKHRSIAGVAALASRTFLVQIISFAATFALTIFLDPKIYGTFFLVSAVINFLTYFSDIGLAAALIQKKTQIRRADLVTTFTIQQILVLSLLTLLFIFTPFLKNYYQLSTPSLYLLWSLAISFFFSSLKTIPTILLERNLQFNKLIIPQIAENLVFNLSAVFLAWQGYGLSTFTYAVFLRGLIGLVLMYLVSPWKPGLGINRSSLKSLLNFGLPYQLNTFLAVIKDDGMTVILGKLIGETGLGYIGWASKWAFMPLRFFMDNVTKVAFPAYSRVQHDKALLKSGIEKTIFYLSLISLPAFVGMAALAQPLVHLIPRYEKWQPALIPLYLYLINAAMSSISTPLTNALNAIGKIKITFKLMIMWTALTWLLMPYLALRYGYLGVSIAAALISLTSIIVMIVVRHIVKVNFKDALLAPTLASLAMGLVILLLNPLITSLPRLFIVIPTASVFYGIIVFIIQGPQIITQLKNLYQTAKLQS